VDDRLAAMSDLQPPADIAEEWSTSKAFYEKVAAQLGTTPGG
jgi:hypothetical protein